MGNKHSFRLAGRSRCVEECNGVFFMERQFHRISLRGAVELVFVACRPRYGRPLNCDDPTVAKSPAEFGCRCGIVGSGNNGTGAAIAHNAGQFSGRQSPVQRCEYCPEFGEPKEHVQVDHAVVGQECDAVAPADAVTIMEGMSGTVRSRLQIAEGILPPPWVLDQGDAPGCQVCAHGEDVAHGHAGAESAMCRRRCHRRP